MEQIRKRPPFRREMIVSAAAGLFRARGYRGTSIEDIGTAVGMTGPAIYRHFPSKEALLTELLERAVRRAQRDVASVLELRLPPRQTLEQIVHRSVAHAIEESDLVEMAAREGQSVSSTSRRRIQREQRAVLHAWLDALLAARPELEPEDARAIVRGVVSLITAVSRIDGLAPDRAQEIFTRMAVAALFAR